MLAEIISSVGAINSFVLTVTLLSGAYFIVPIIYRYIEISRAKIPPHGAPILNVRSGDYEGATSLYLNDLKSLLSEGYRKYRHQVYQIWGVDGYITIVPTEFCEELNNLPKDMLDFHAATQKRMVGDYTWVQIADDLEAHTILTDLTRNISKILPDLQSEVEQVFQELIPAEKDTWLPVIVWPTMLRLIVITIGRVFVGPGMNRNEEWIQASLDFVNGIFAGGWKLKRYSLFMRPFAARYLVPEIRQVWRSQATARRLLVPIMQRRKTEQQNPDHQKPSDMIQWLMDNNDKLTEPRSLDNLAELCLVVVFAALHTSTQTLTHIILDLAARPDYIEPLREEIEHFEQDQNDSDRKGPLTAAYMTKLDSFMKESQRLSPASLLSFSRLCVQDVTLSDGTRLPTGTHILCPSSMLSLDDQNYNTPEKFDGFRFSKMRESDVQEGGNRFQFTTTSPKNQMHFGYGRQACPGRFFAGAEIKAILYHLLRDFDIKLVDEKAGRPANTIKGAQVLPPETAQVMFRKR